MKSRKNKPTITQDEVQKALLRFKKEGGLIKKLPDQIAPANTFVGGKWAMYESPLGQSGGSGMAS